MFDLMRPCGNCPFKKGNGSMFGLEATRLMDIFKADGFQCHKTIGKKPEQCAGLLAILNKEDKQNQMMQLGQRFGALDLSKLDPDNETYSSLASAATAHLKGVEEEP